MAWWRRRDGACVLRVDWDGPLPTRTSKTHPGPHTLPPPSPLFTTPLRTLVFSSAAPVPAWRYIPVPEVFTVPGPAGGVCALASDVGPLHARFSGSGAWVPAPPGVEGVAALRFSFNTSAVAWGKGGKVLWQGPRDGSKARHYTFFGLQKGSGVVCARSSGGPLNVLARKAG